MTRTASGSTLTSYHQLQQWGRSANCDQALRRMGWQKPCPTMGTAFTSNKFREFLQQNGIEHVRSAPYHPSSNGLAERAVQTVKEGVKKMKGPLEARFLFKYRVTPQATTGIAPAELLMGRRLRTHLDLLYPSVKDRVRQRQMAQETRTSEHGRQFKPKLGDRVMCRNFADGPKWLPGVITECDSATSVKVKPG